MSAGKYARGSSLGNDAKRAFKHGSGTRMRKSHRAVLDHAEKRSKEIDLCNRKRGNSGPG